MNITSLQTLKLEKDEYLIISLPAATYEDSLRPVMNCLQECMPNYIGRIIVCPDSIQFKKLKIEE